MKRQSLLNKQNIQRILSDMTLFILVGFGVLYIVDSALEKFLNISTEGMEVWWQQLLVALPIMVIANVVIKWFKNFNA